MAGHGICCVAICLPLRYTTQRYCQNCYGNLPQKFLCCSFCFLCRSSTFMQDTYRPLYILWTHSWCPACLSINMWYGFCVPIVTVILDVILIAVSHTLILCAAFKLPSQVSQKKAFSPVVCVICMLYIPAFFSLLARCFGHNVFHTFHSRFANSK